MARLVVSFKDGSEEEMKLYKQIIKDSCGDKSAYAKTIFRKYYGDDITFEDCVEPTNAKCTEKVSQDEDEGEDIDLEVPEIPKSAINPTTTSNENTSKKSGFNIAALLNDNMNIEISK